MNPGPTMRARRRLLACALALPVVLGIAPVARADLVSTLARVKPSVVAVGTYQRTRSPAFVFRGTGFAIGDGMLVATNAHVLPEEVDGARMEGLVIVLPGDDLTGAVRPVARGRQRSVGRISRCCVWRAGRRSLPCGSLPAAGWSRGRRWPSPAFRSVPCSA